MDIEQLQQQINELNGVMVGLRADLGAIQQQLCEQSAQLPQAIKAAIANELRPGGVLYRARSGDGARGLRTSTPNSGTSPVTQPEVGSTITVFLPEGQAQAQVVGTYPTR